MAGRCEVKVTDMFEFPRLFLPSFLNLCIVEGVREGKGKAVCRWIELFFKLSYETKHRAQSWCHCVAVPKYNSISCFHFPPPSIQKWQPVTSSDAADSRRSAPITAQCPATRLGLHQSEASSQAEGPWRHGLYFPVATAPAMAMVSWEDWRLTVLRTDWHWQPGYWGPARLSRY